MPAANSDPLDVIVPDTMRDYARRTIKICEKKLAEQTDPLSRYYYEKCIEGHRRNLEAEQE